MRHQLKLVFTRICCFCKTHASHSHTHHTPTRITLPHAHDTSRYGVPSYFAEYDAKLGQAVADPVRVSSGGAAEVWMREFDHGFVVVSSVVGANTTVTLPVAVRELPPSNDTSRARLTGQRDAPAWQLVIDNSLGAPGSFQPAGPDDWWADDTHRARFQTDQGNWTVVSDQTQSHQYGDSFLVGFTEPGGATGTSQGFPGAFSAAWSFVSPADGAFHFSVTAVNAHFYPLTDAAVVCITESAAHESAAHESVSASAASKTAALAAPFDAECIVRTTVDQRGGSIRDGRWQRVASGVPLRASVEYTVTIAWDPTCSGYVAADALLVESDSLYHSGAALGKQVTVGALDSRIVLKV
jgi:hypothetical protein